MAKRVEKFEELDLVRLRSPIHAESAFKGAQEMDAGTEALIVRDLGADCYELEFDDPSSGLPIFHAAVHAEDLVKVII